MIRREDALNLVKENVKNKNLVKHMLACEACMEKLAEYFDKDTRRWGIAGLLHDLDYPETADNPDRHGYETVEKLKEHDIDEGILNAILAHPGHKERDTLIEKCLYSVDPLTGLIVASTLMHPEKKLRSVDRAFIMRRFDEKRFAAGADRDQIRAIESTGLTLEKFVDICLGAMQGVSEDLGL